jgi:cGMP-dependent protein kinase
VCVYVVKCVYLCIIPFLLLSLSYLRTRHCLRTASVVADTKVTVQVLDRESFQGYFRQRGVGVRFARRKSLPGHGVILSQPDTTNMKYAQGKDADSRLQRDVFSSRFNFSGQRSRDMDTYEKQAIIGEMKTKLSIISPIDEKDCESFIDSMWQVEVPAGETLIRQGEPGDNYYIIDRGQFDVFVRDEETGKDVFTRTLKDGMSFGELALIFNAARSATVQAKVKSVVWAVDRTTFYTVLRSVHQTQLERYREYLARTQILKVMPDKQLQQIAEALDEISFAPGHRIIKQGDTGDSFYILVSGECAVSTVVGQSPTGADRVKMLNRLRTPGEYFGEMALVTGNKRSAYVTAVTAVECLFLKRDLFLKLIQPVRGLIEDKFSDYELNLELAGEAEEQGEDEQDLQEFEDGLDQSLDDEEQYKTDMSIEFKHLEHWAKLGSGLFGNVDLVKDRKTDNTYVLKTLEKSQVEFNEQTKTVRRQKMLLQSLRHPLIGRLYRTFRDSANVYMLLEPLMGGTVLTRLQAAGCFNEPTARFICGCVCQIFDYLHNHNVIFRNLKPEKLLIDARGYVKVCDFEFAKLVRSSDRTYTMCGTPDFMAPEVILGQGHSYACDWWALGVLLFEMLSGVTPFLETSILKTYEKILSGDVAFPLQFSAHATLFIKGLLQTKPAHRLGYVSSAEVKRHEFFSKRFFDWQALRQASMKSRLQVQLKDELDTRYFDDSEDFGVGVPASLRRGASTSTWDRGF